MRGPTTSATDLTSSPNAHRTDTDFGAEQVTSKPRTDALS